MINLYTSWLLKFHRIVAIGCVLVVAVLALGAKNLTITNDLRVYFSDENPQLAAFDQLENTYNKQDNIVFLILPDNGEIYSKSVLQLIWQLSEAAWQLPYAQRVTSLANYQHTYAIGDELVTEFLIDSPEGLTPARIAAIQAIAEQEPVLRNLIPLQANATLINVSLTLPAESLTANDEVFSAAQGLIKQYGLSHPHITILNAGAAAANVSLGKAVERDLETLVAISYAVIIAGLLVLLRSRSGTLATVVLITFSVIGTFGFFGWMNSVLTPVAGFVPSVVMTIAVADSVHILISYYYALRQGLDKHAAITESMRINANPVFITSVTTIIGVLCLNFSDSPPYRDLGNMLAVGVMLAYLFSMSFLPAFLAWVPVSRYHSRRGDSLIMDNLAAWIMRRHKLLLISIGMSVGLLISFIPRNELTERWHEYFDTSFEVRQAVEIINQSISGVHTLRYHLDSGKENGVNDPLYLQTLDRFAQWYRDQPGVAYVASLSDTIKRLNRNLHNDDPDWYRIPESRELSAQYLLLYELSLPLGLGLENTINMQRSATQFIVIMKKSDSEALLAMDKEAQTWLAQHAKDIILPTEASGLDMVFAHINHRNIRSLLTGTAVALVLISCVLILALRSVRLGLISLIPNLAPAALAYGTWGLFVGRIDLSASIVICMSLGIVVDDTVHFLSKYLRARREKNLDIQQGMHYAFHTVGTALSITTAVLVSGFLVLAASNFSPTQVCGLLLSITLAYALLVDFLLLPPLLMILDRHAYRASSATALAKA